MSVFGPTVKCGDCGKALDEVPNLPPQERFLCPGCSCESRALEITVSDTITVTVRERRNILGRRPGFRRPSLEMLGGDAFNRRLGKYVKHERVIDREKNWYKERVTDPDTGQVLHECEEPLTEHRGHGSARRGEERDNGN